MGILNFKVSNVDSLFDRCNIQCWTQKKKISKPKDRSIENDQGAAQRKTKNENTEQKKYVGQMYT